MTPRFLVPLLLALALVALTLGAAFAQPSKLDPRARAALASMRGGTSAAQARIEGLAVDPTGDLDVFIVGDVSRAELEAAGARVRTEVPGAGIFTAYLPTDAVDAVAALAGVRSIHGAALCEPELDVSVPTTGASLLRGAGPAFTGLNGQGVLLGDVDSGIDFDHGDFEDAGGNTRLVNLWDQTSAVGPAPAGFAIGREWTPAEINGGLCTETDTDAHGTHVMGILGGDGSQTGNGVAAHTYAGMAPLADLLMVKTTFFSTDILDGVTYIFGRATALGKPACVNLSLGSHYGPHDGTSPFEAGLSALSGPGRVVVKSAGNERSSTNIRHAEVFAAGAGTSATMSITGSANNRIIGIDGYYEASENLNVQITTPGGTVIGPIPVGFINAAYPGTLTANGYVYVENGAFVTATGDPEVYIEIRGQTAASANGSWTFTFIPVTLGAASGEVDLWRFFNSAGISGNFVVGADNGTEIVSEPGNAVEVITTGAWTSKQSWIACSGSPTTFTGTPAPGNLATFSSPGPTRDGRMKPDITAPGIAIGSTRSFDLVSACPPGLSAFLADGENHLVNAGTSMAAPHTTGAVGLLMQKYGMAVTPAFAKSFFAARATVDGFTGAVPNKDWGAGKLNLGDLLDPYVTVVSPNGGESYIISSMVPISWTAGDNVSVSSVDILLSRTGAGGPFTPIATGVPNTGSYSWSSTFPASNDCYVKVVAGDPSGNTGEDVSDAYFALIDPATPALLSLLETEGGAGGVTVRWRFSSEASFSRVGVERGESRSGPFAALSAQAVLQGETYTLTDATVESGRTYWYRLVATTPAGGTMTFGPIEATVGVPVTEFAIGRITPNPTSDEARVDFAVPVESRVRISVLDVQGREIARLADGLYRAGRYQTVWDGGANRGGRAPAGLYFVRLSAPGKDLVQRIVLSR